MLIKILKQYIKNFKDDDEMIILEANTGQVLELFNVCKNLDTENLELQVIIEENNDQ